MAEGAVEEQATRVGDETEVCSYPPAPSWRWLNEGTK